MKYESARKGGLISCPQTISRLQYLSSLCGIFVPYNDSRQSLSAGASSSSPPILVSPIALMKPQHSPLILVATDEPSLQTLIVALRH